MYLVCMRITNVFGYFCFFYTSFCFLVKSLATTCYLHFANLEQQSKEHWFITRSVKPKIMGAFYFFVVPGSMQYKGNKVKELNLSMLSFLTLLLLMLSHGNEIYFFALPKSMQLNLNGQLCAKIWNFFLKFSKLNKKSWEFFVLSTSIQWKCWKLKCLFFNINILLI